MISCVIDSREQELIKDLEGFDNVKSEMLTIGDLIVYNEEKPIFLIERKSVRDLVQSLKDGRYHDQRRRWKEFQNDFPDLSVSLWVEGDLMGVEMDETLRGSLLNSLFRLQSIHGVIVHHVKNRNAFVKSLKLVLEKFNKDPSHLLGGSDVKSSNTLDMRNYKKDKNGQESFWRNCLSLISGVSQNTAMKIVQVFPTLKGFIEQDKIELEKKLSEISIGKRKLGKALADKIIKHVMGEEEVSNS